MLRGAPRCKPGHESSYSPWSVLSMNDQAPKRHGQDTRRGEESTNEPTTRDDLAMAHTRALADLDPSGTDFVQQPAHRHQADVEHYGRPPPPEARVLRPQSQTDTQIDY